MKGTIRRPPDPFRKHLINDYRDPEPQKLPPGPEYQMKEKPDMDSVFNVRSNDEVWDRLCDLKLLRRNKYTSFAGLKNRQRAILLSMPRLDSKQLRRQKLPANECIPLELEEKKYYLASALLKYFMNQHDRIISKFGSSQAEQEAIRQQPKKIQFLAKILEELNIYIIKGNIRSFITLTFNCGMFFERKCKQWWWMSHEFYKIAKEVSYLIKNDFGYSQAIINYMFGKFLLFKLEDLKAAIECLVYSWTLSKGKVWNVEWATGVQNERISECSRTLIYIAYLAQAEAISYDDPELAMKKAEEAINIAQKGNDIIEAKFNYAVYSLQANKLTETLKMLNNISTICEKGKNLDMYLSVQFLLVEYFMRVQNPDKALKKLASIAELGIQLKVGWLRALTSRYIAQIYLQKDCANHESPTNTIKINQETSI